MAQVQKMLQVIFTGINSISKAEVLLLNLFNVSLYVQILYLIIILDGFIWNMSNGKYRRYVGGNQIQKRSQEFLFSSNVGMDIENLC